MKVVWEEGDIQPGRQVQKPACGVTGRYIIGYDPADKSAGERKILFLIGLADGMIYRPGAGTQESIANWLTKNGIMPIELVQK